MFDFGLTQVSTFSRQSQSAIQNLKTKIVMPGPVVVVMCKAPRAGDVKTRLTPFLPAVEAAALAARMFQDAVLNAARSKLRVLVAYAPGDGRAALEELLPAEASGVQFFEQRGSNLGERLEAAAAEAFARDFDSAVLMGTDTIIPPMLLKLAASRLLTAADLALGPAEDGGCYLIGLRRPVRGPYEGVEWGTEHVHRRIAENAARLGLRLCEKLPRLHDVDTPEDFERLRRELLANPQRALLLAPSTYCWLEEREGSKQ